MVWRGCKCNPPDTCRQEGTEEGSDGPIRVGVVWRGFGCFEIGVRVVWRGCKCKPPDTCRQGGMEEDSDGRPTQERVSWWSGPVEDVNTSCGGGGGGGRFGWSSVSKWSGER